MEDPEDLETPVRVAITRSAHVSALDGRVFSNGWDVIATYGSEDPAVMQKLNGGMDMVVHEALTYDEALGVVSMLIMPRRGKRPWMERGKMPQVAALALLNSGKA